MFILLYLKRLNRENFKEPHRGKKDGFKQSSIPKCGNHHALALKDRDDLDALQSPFRLFFLTAVLQERKKPPQTLVTPQLPSCPSWGQDTEGGEHTYLLPPAEQSQQDEEPVVVSRASSSGSAPPSGSTTLLPDS